MMKQKSPASRCVTTVIAWVPYVFIFLLFFLVFISPLASVHAQIKKAVLGPTTETNTLLQNISGDISKIKSPGEVVGTIVQIVLGLLGLVGVVMMIYAGFLWLTAGGEEEKAKQGRMLLFQAVIGTLIVLAAYTIVYFVLRELTKAVAG